MGRKTHMNSLTSPELLGQVNSENQYLLGEFQDYLKSVQRSPQTIDGYTHDIWIAWVWNLQHNNNITFTDWKVRHVVKYQSWILNENKNSPARVRRLKASLSSLSNFIENVMYDEYPNFRNIINKVENPENQPVREKTILSREELEGLLKVLTDKKQYMKACFLALAMYGGRRKSELCRFRVSDFAEDDKHVVCDGALYKSDPIKTKGRGGGKMLECYTLRKPFQPYFDMWMKDREERGIESKWLFPQPNNPDEHIGVSMANSWANSFSRILGKDVYIHSLRHHVVSELSRQGLSDNAVVLFMGWSDSSGSQMFSIYNDNPKDDQLAAWFKNGEINTSGKKGITDL